MVTGSLFINFVSSADIRYVEIYANMCICQLFECYCSQHGVTILSESSLKRAFDEELL